MQAVVNATLGMNTLSILTQNSTTLTLRVATTAQVSTAPLSLESGSGCVVLSTQAISIAAPPTVTGISTSMPEVGQTFVLTGTNFVPGTIVTLGGITAASVEVVSPTEIRVAFGMNALAAAAQGAPLQVITPFGTAVFMDGLIRLLPQTVIPTGIDFTPERGTQNSTVTITGRGFVGVRQVFFGTTPALSFRVESPERIVAIVSTGATGVVRVSSTTGTGESMRIFTFVSPQELDSIAALTLFRATNGMNWTTNANWTNPRASYTTWFGLTIPASGANAGRITAVNLPANGLTGSVTNAIIALSQMSALQSVNLSGNTALGGTLGSVVAGLRSVRSLNLANTGLQGRLPLELGLLDSLEVLKLDSNRLEGTIADVYCTVFGLTQRNFSLREMRLASNRLTGEIPPCIVQFTRLQVLRLENNQFTGRIPEGINRLAQLREFVLARNNLTGQLPRSLDSTTFTAFAGKPVNGNGAETQALTQLEIFDVSNNQLSGTVPNGIAQSRNMKTLLLNNNAFTGTLPETLPSLGFLERFNASNNQFSGEIWEGVGMMRSLREFAVRNNRLSGTIPSTFTQIPTLQRLELDNNALTGDVPTDLNRLGTMRVLGLSGNRLRTAPSFVGLRQTLDSLRLERNMLTFESIEPSMQVQNFTYSPQDSVGVAESRFFRVGSRIPLQFSVGGEFNRYQWFQNGRAVTPLQESPSFVLTENALIEQSGVYECRITNALARGLTLFARPLTIRIDTAAPTSPDVLGNQVAAPVLVFPYPAGRNMPYSLPLRWRNAEGASVYEVQFSLLNDFSILVTNATLSSTSLSVSALRPGTRYHWRVRSIGSEGQRSVWVSDFFTTGVNDKPMQMTSVDFGKVSLADSTDGEALIVNFSNVAQTLQEITLDDPNLSFSVLDNVQQTVIPAEKFIAVRVRFAPRSTGVKLATSILRYNESLRPERTDSVQNILQGTGVALKLTNVDFDTVRAGGTTIKSALLINTSPRAVRVGVARAVNPDGGNVFSVESYLGDKNFDLKPNDTLAIVVRCSPPNVGRKFAGLLVLGDNESVTANIRAVARTFRDGDVIVSFGIRPERDSIAPGGSVGVQLYIKADARTRNLTTDLLRAVQPRYQARLRFNPKVLMLDRAENRARQQVLNGTAFVSIPVTQWNFDVNNLTARELPLLTLRGLSISGSTTSTLMQIESASWEPLTMGSSAAIFVEAPINSTFNSLACVAGGTRLTTTAERNAVAVSRPNPVKDVAEVQYSLREDGNIALSMIDMSGKQVAVLAEGYADAGRYSVMLSVQAIPSGAYFLVLQTTSGIVRQRVDVVK
jgi:Leucine-rich repeat (LRR) protein